MEIGKGLALNIQHDLLGLISEYCLEKSLELGVLLLTLEIFYTFFFISKILVVPKLNRDTYHTSGGKYCDLLYN